MQTDSPERQSRAQNYQRKGFLSDGLTKWPCLQNVFFFFNESIHVAGHSCQYAEEYEAEGLHLKRCVIPHRWEA